MAKTGYYFHEISDETLKWMQEYGCERTYHDRAVTERHRPQLRQALMNLNVGDEFIIAKLSNTVHGSQSLNVLLEFCRLKQVRLVSVEDKLDTADELYPCKSTSVLIDIMGRLPHEAIALRKLTQRKMLKPVASPKSKVREEKLTRDITAINMYLSGHNIAAIARYLGITTRTLFRIIKRNNIPHRLSPNGE